MGDYHCAGMRHPIEDTLWRTRHPFKNQIGHVQPMPPLLPSASLAPVNLVLDRVSHFNLPDVFQTILESDRDERDNSVVVKALEEFGKTGREYLRCSTAVAMKPEDHTLAVAHINASAQVEIERTRKDKAIATKPEDHSRVIAEINATAQVEIARIQAKRDVDLKPADHVLALANIHETAETGRERIRADKDIAIALAMAESQNLGHLAQVARDQIAKGFSEGMVSNHKGEWIRFQGRI